MFNLISLSLLALVISPVAHALEIASFEFKMDGHPSFKIESKSLFFRSGQSLENITLDDSRECSNIQTKILNEYRNFTNLNDQESTLIGMSYEAQPELLTYLNPGKTTRVCTIKLQSPYKAAYFSTLVYLEYDGSSDELKQSCNQHALDIFKNQEYSESNFALVVEAMRTTSELIGQKPVHYCRLQLQGLIR